MAACGASNQPPSCDDCLEVVKTKRTVHVPCRYNTYKHVTVKVPRQVKEQVPRTINYTDYETRQKQVPYTVNRSERRTRMETQKYQVPVKKCYTVMETREKQVPVPYYVNVPETKYRSESYEVPVQRSKVHMDTVVRTVYDTQVRRRCVPQTRMCSKELPVYNVVAKPCGDCQADDIVDDFNRMDVNQDGMLSYEEMFGSDKAKHSDQVTVGKVSTGAISHDALSGAANDSGLLQHSGNGENYNEVAVDVADANPNVQPYDGFYNQHVTGSLGDTPVYQR